MLRGLEPTRVFASARTGEGIAERARGDRAACCPTPRSRSTCSCRTTAATSCRRCTRPVACCRSSTSRTARASGARLARTGGAARGVRRGIRARLTRSGAPRRRSSGDVPNVPIRAVTPRHSARIARACGVSSLVIVGARPDAGTWSDSRARHPPATPTCRSGRGTRPAVPSAGSTGAPRRSTMAETGQDAGGADCRTRRRSPSSCSRRERMPRRSPSGARSTGSPRSTRRSSR